MASFRVLLVLLLCACLFSHRALSEEDEEEESPYEHRYTVYNRLSHHPTFSKRGELFVIPSRAVARYVSGEDEVAALIGPTDREQAAPVCGPSASNKFYHIKLVDEEDQRKTYLSFTKWHLLQASSFEDEIIVHLDGDNNLVHFDYYTALDQCNGTKPEQVTNFRTTVQTIKAVKGVRPKLVRAAPLRADGTVESPPAEKSFLQKYWVYIVPLVVIMLFTGGPPEEEGQGNQGGGGNQAGSQGTRQAARQ